MSFFISNLISILLASAVASFLLTRIFKKSIFVRVGIIWVINLLFLMLMTGIKYKFYDGEVLINAVITLINIVVSVICFYYASVSVVRPLSNAIDKINQVAEGNLNVSLDIEKANTNNDLGILLLSVNKLKENLTNILTALNTKSNDLTNSGILLNRVSQKVSEGVNEQAASSEEASSSIVEMVANIQQNARNAQDTKAISQKVLKGVQKMSEASHDSLNSLRTINDKIKVVNDIAFQTNILALNASVEAARAGEHGRGFSVVAQEVRKLAELSKSAADEIVRLTNESLKSSEFSTGLMETLYPEIEKTVMLVEEIAASSLEQNTGADQINSVIHQLNSIAQENAAASEDMASSAIDINNHAKELKEVIKFFKTDQVEKEVEV
jgi:methyl-accepting chemotaxis protein